MVTYRVKRRIKVDGEYLEPGTILEDTSKFVRIEALVRNGKLEVVDEDGQAMRHHRRRLTGIKVEKFVEPETKAPKAEPAPVKKAPAKKTAKKAVAKKAASHE